MTVFVMAFVVLAALLGVAAGVWVAMRDRNGAETTDERP